LHRSIHVIHNHQPHLIITGLRIGVHLRSIIDAVVEGIVIRTIRMGSGGLQTTTPFTISKCLMHCILGLWKPNVAHDHRSRVLTVVR
jgi:hypothetical protein